MAPPPAVPISWPIVLGVFSAFAPPAAALWARRLTWREPVGQVAICWLVMAVVGLLQYLRALQYVPLALPIGYVATVGFPLLLVPPTFAWIGSAARRWQWPVLALWSALCVVALVALPTAREFRALVQPLMALGMCIVSGVALTARVHHADGPVSRNAWFWILPAHVVYFASDILRQPLLEVLAAYHYATMVQVHMGLIFVYVAIYALLTRGMLQR